MVGIKGADDLIVQSALIIVHQPGVIGVIGIEILRELQKVISTARLIEVGVCHRLSFLHAIGCHREYLRVRLAEHLPIADTTGCIHITSLYEMPEVVSYIIIMCIMVALVRAKCTDNHRDMLVGMARADVINVLSQGFIELRCIKTLSSLKQSRLIRRVWHHL